VAKRSTNRPGPGRLRPPPEKANSSLMRYRISSFFRLNWTTKKQATQWRKKVWILKLRARETTEKVKMCQNWGSD
jgi:hypothetical protein